jgi:hypothetical protein
VSRIRGACALLAVGLAGALIVGSAAAQPVAAPRLKAAFVANLTQFVQWPADAVAVGAPLVMCVVDDPAVARALEDITRGRAIGGHSVTVKTVAAEAALPSCDVLYLNRSSGRRSGALIATVQGSCVLTISDIPDFARVGGIVELMRENDRIGIIVNVVALSRAGIRLNSGLLALATIVDEPPVQAVPRKGGTAP